MFEQNLCLKKQGETEDTPAVHTVRIKRDFNNFIADDEGYYIFGPTENSEPSIPPVKPTTPGLYLLVLKNDFEILSKPNNGSLLVNLLKITFQNLYFVTAPLFFVVYFFNFIWISLSKINSYF